MQSIRIKIYKSFSTELENIWKNFEKESSAHIFQTYNWQKLWMQNQLDHKLKITNYTILVFKEERLIMILPFNIKKFFFIKILNWSGFPFSDYNIPIISKFYNISDSEFSEIWKNILKNYNFDCIILENQPDKIFFKKNPFFFNLKNQITSEYYGNYLDKNSELNYKQIKNIIYQEKRLKNLGKLSFNIANNKDEKLKVLRFIIEHKSKQYQNTNAWDLFKIKSIKDFFIASNFYLKNYNYLTYLTLDDKIIAAHSGFVYNSIFYYLFPTFDLKFKKYSPGKILLKKLINDSKLKGLRYFDFTIGSENYKKYFSNDKLFSGRFLDFINLRGKLYLYILKLKYNLKNFIKSN